MEMYKDDVVREDIIELKYQYSKLRSELRNMLKTMANDIERFELINSEHYRTFVYGMSNISHKHTFKPSIVDKVSGKVFDLTETEVQVNGVSVFSGDELHVLVLFFGCLMRAKKNQDYAISEFKKEEEIKNILSEFN